MKTQTSRVATRSTLLATSLGMALASHAAVTPIIWSGASGVDATTWSDGSNWSGGLAPADDLVTHMAVFSLADFTGKQPNAGTRSVGGIQVGSGSATGALTVSGTQLTLGASGIDMKANAGAATIALPVALGADQTWANASANSLTLTGATSGGFNLAKSGSGKIILTGTSSRSGATSIGGGTLQLGSTAANAAVGTGTYDISSGSILRLEYATSSAALTNLGNLPWANFTGAGTLNIAANGVFDYIASGTALPAGFTGTLRVDGGRVMAAAAPDGGLGGTTQIIVKNGGQFGMWEGGTFSQDFLIDGTGYGEAGYDVALRMANNTKTVLVDGTITLAGNAAIGSQGGGTSTIANPIGENTPSNLMVGGGSQTGTVVFQGTNTYTGTTTVRGGILSLAAAAPTVLGTFIMSGGDGTFARMQQPNQFAPGVVANFTSGAGSWNRFEMFGKDQTFAGITTGTLTGQGGGVIQNSEANGAAGANATLTLNGSGSYVFNGHLRDYGTPNAGTNKLSLIKNGSGTQTLVGGVISYSGTTALNSGTLELVSTSAFKSAVTVASGTTLKLGNNGDVATGAGFTVDLNSGTVLTHDGQVAANHFWVIGGAVTTTGSTTINQHSIAAGATNKSLFFDGGLKGSGTVTINATNAGNGVIFRNNNSTFSGNLIVNGIADADVNEGSGIGVGGCTTALQNTDIQLNGTMELLNQGVGWGGAASGAFRMGALSGSGVVVGNFTGTGNTTVTLGHTNNSATFSGSIANGVNNTTHLVKTGTGTQTLTGVNTYTGNTTVDAGILAISGGDSLSDIGTLSVADVAGAQITFANDETVGGLGGGGTAGGLIDLQGHTLTLSGEGNTSFGGTLSGTGSALIKTGGGTQTLSGVNNYTGPTTIQAGRFDLASALPNSTLSAADGAALGGEGEVPTITLGSSSGANLFAVPATAGALTASGALTVNGTTLVDITGPVTTPAFKILQFGSKGNAFTNANFELADPTPYRPGYAFTVNANDVTLTMAKKTLEWTAAEDGFWESGFGANFRDIITLTPETFFEADDVIFGNLPAADQTVEIIGEVVPSSVTFDSTHNYTILGGIITGPGGVTKNGSGTATLSAADTYTGTTTVNTGTLVFKTPGNVDWTLPTGTKTIANGGTLKVDFTPQSPTQFRHTHLGPIAINAGGVLDLYSTTYNINSWHLIQSWTGGVTGGGSIRVSGGGAVALWTGAANPLSTFQGVIDVQDGQFAVNVDNGVTVGGPLDVSLAALGKLDMRTGHFTIDALDGVAGSQIIKSHNTAVTLTVGNNNGSGNFAGNLSNANGTIALTKTGTGTQTLSGTNTHTGTTTVNGGTLALTGGAAIADTGAVVLADAEGAQVLLNASETIGTLAGGGAAGGSVNLQGNTLTVGTTASTAFAGSITGTGGLTKVGTGTLTLSGANSYSGDTTVNAGVLSLSSPTLADSSTVTLLTGAVLNLAADDTVAALVIGVDPMPPGLYSSSHPTYGAYFTGAGSLIVGSGNAYTSWASAKGLVGADALGDADPDKDGISNAIEFAIDGQPNPANPSSNSNALLPTLSLTPTHLVFTYRRSDAAHAMPGVAIAAEYGSALTPVSWATAQHGVDGVTIITTNDGFTAGVDKVEVSIPRPAGPPAKLFARLKVTLP